MKSRHLPETDIANLAFRGRQAKRTSLESWLKPRKFVGSYAPFRRTSGDAVNRQLPLFPSGQVPTPWAKLEQLVVEACRGDEDLLHMNLPIARSAHAFATLHNLVAEPVDVRSLTLAPGHAYEFGLPLLFRYDAGVSIAFPDLRRTGRLTALGSLVAYSVQHERFRAAYPEYHALRLETWRFANNDARTVVVSRHDDQPLIPYADLLADFTETYEMLNSLLAEREEARRRTRGGFGPLFGT